MTVEELLTDIPLDQARNAYNGTSWTPEKRGDQTRKDYAETLFADYTEFSAVVARHPERESVLNVEFARYRAGYRERYLAWLSAHSRCLSWAITGPSNFPSARNAKRNDTADRRMSELIEFRARAKKAIMRELRPELRPVMAGDQDATARLQRKIDQAERLQEVMVKTNSALRLNRAHGAEAQVKAMAEVFKAAGLYAGDEEVQAAKLLRPDFAGRVGFPAYALQNNNANIRRMRGRLESIQTAKQTPASEIEGENARLEDCPADNRVRLFYPAKPAAEVRERLKGSGFRWSPTLGCWQAFRNYRSLATARAEAGIPETWPPSGEDVAPLAPAFVAEIEALAAGCGKTPLAVFELWRQYAKECQGADQSALVSEFKEWYKRDLAPAAAEVTP